MDSDEHVFLAAVMQKSILSILLPFLFRKTKFDLKTTTENKKTGRKNTHICLDDHGEAEVNR